MQDSKEPVIETYCLPDHNHKLKVNDTSVHDKVKVIDKQAHKHTATNQDSLHPSKNEACVFRTSVNKFKTLGSRSSIKPNIPNFDHIPSSNLCLKHKRQLEVLCLDDKCKICTQCALFGDHKHHEIKNEEDIFNEVKIRAEIYVELFELLESNESSFNENVNKLTIHNIYLIKL